MKMMERLIEVPPEPEQGNHRHDVNIMNDVMLENAWTGSSAATNISNNILYIAVEYVKDGQLKIESEPHQSALSPRETFSEFDQHVSPLDPNMCSVAAGYSPIYVSSTQNEYDGSNIMIVTAEGHDNNSPTPRVPQTENSRYIQLESASNSTEIISDADSLQIIPEGEQEVSLLIMDQNTGISYSVNAQEYLEDRNLADDQQLLANLAPVSLLDSDLLTLDENALKAQLSKIVDPDLRNITTENTDDVLYEPVRLKRCIKTQIKRHSEDDLSTCVQAITDKPILSRARATLPESHLSLRQLDNMEFGVFTKKYIPNRTQFGPLEGIISNEEIKLEEDLVLSIETAKGMFQYLDISNEDYSNWMVFVRKAKNYDEQNCVLVQFENNLYYTTIKNILPKQELLVGYGMMYAKARHLPVFEPEVKLEPCWPCFECSETFQSSFDLQNHLDSHDPLNMDNTYRNKHRNLHKRRKTLMNISNSKIPAVECSLCGRHFEELHLRILKEHLRVEHNVSCKDKLSEHCKLLHDRNVYSEISIDDFAEQIKVEEVNLVIEKKKFSCPICKKTFLTTDRLQRHLPIHDSNALKPIQCQHCPKRFLTLAALLCHDKMHQPTNDGVGGSVMTARRVHECPICLEKFSHVLQLKVHVVVHANEGGRFTCPHCNKMFGKYGVIRKHIRAFHCERRHQCPLCPMRFPSQDKLRMHQLRHSDHKEFLCANCGKQFKRKDKLQEHCRRMHAPKAERDRIRMSRNVTIVLKRQQRERQRQRQKVGEDFTGGRNIGVKKVKNKMEGNYGGEKKFVPKVQPTDYHRFIYKCHKCLVGFKRRGMLVNHLAKRHPDIPACTVPELNLPILRATRDYFCTHCDKVYRSSSKRKAHMVQKHPGAELPASSRRQRQAASSAGPAAAAVIICTTDGGAVIAPDATYSQTVGSITTSPQSCQWCHKQYASKAKLLQHQRREHKDVLQEIAELKKFERSQQLEKLHAKHPSKKQSMTLSTTTTKTSRKVVANNANINVLPSLINNITSTTSTNSAMNLTAAGAQTTTSAAVSQRYTINIKEHRIINQQQVNVNHMSYLSTDEMMIMQQQTHIVEENIHINQNMHLNDVMSLGVHDCQLDAIPQPHGGRCDREFGYHFVALDDTDNHNEASLYSPEIKKDGDVIADGNRLLKLLTTDNNLVPPR